MWQPVVRILGAELSVVAALPVFLMIAAGVSAIAIWVDRLLVQAVARVCEGANDPEER